MSNFNLGVSLNDYSSGQNDNQVLFDNSNATPEQLSELSKSLEAGSLTGQSVLNSNTASGAPLKVESLENTLKVLTFKESDIQFWKRIPKLAAYNTVEEYNQLQSYGNVGNSFNNEGELPREEDSIYVRKAEIVKFMGITKSVSHPMQLVRSNIASVMQQEVKNGTLKLLRDADRNLAFANSSIIPQEWNGLYAQHRNAFSSNLTYFKNNEVTIDLRGKSLREADIENGALAIISNFGQPNLLMAPPVVLSDFIKTFYGNKFIQPNTSALTDGVMGQRVQRFQSQYGEIELGYDIFLGNNPPRKTTDSATSPQAPATPITPVFTTPTDPNTQFDVATQAGNYYYAVSSINRFGESSLLAITPTASAVAIGQAAELGFVTAGGPNPATGFVIYRSEKNPALPIANTPLFPIFSVSVSDQVAGYNGGGANTVRDLNFFIAKCESALLLQSDEEVYSFKQLAPLMKMDLATLSPATRFMILMYGTPMLYAPKKMVRYINIGRDLS